MRTLYLIFCCFFVAQSLSSSTSTSPSSRPRCLHEQSSILLQFKQEFPLKEPEDLLNDYDYPKMETWKAGKDCCSWDGIECDTTGHVIGLDLSNSSLEGPLLSNSSLFSLTHLENLNLANNPKLSGRLSDSSASNLKSLNLLDLNSCNFSGIVPTSIGNLSQLTYLDLSSNNFSGEVPTSLGRLTKLEYLYLQKNRLIGPIPSWLGNLTRLTLLQLSHNNFNGEFPISLANLTQLDSLYVSFNQLVGSIPYEYANRISSSMLLSMLDLSHNSFNGTIPPSLFRIPSLVVLNLDYNQFTGPLTIQNVSSSQLTALYLRRNNLNGQIPTSISELTSLTDLYLPLNNFSGEIELGAFSNLINLDLSYNSLTITSTSTMFALPVNFNSLLLASCNIKEFPKFLETQNELWEMDLSHNKLEGKIPKWFLRVGTESLARLDLSSNLITGWEQEPSILPWEALAYLDLRHNKFQGSLFVPPFSTVHFFIFNNSLTGNVDPIFCELHNLKVLDVSNNNLSGEIPRCLGSNSSLLMLNLQRNNFHGEIPPTCEERSVLKTLDLSHNQLQGKIPKSLVTCKELEVLNIGHNQISDQFPFWTQSLPKLQILVLRSNKFDGPIWHPREFSGFENLRMIDLSFNNFGGVLPSEYFRNWSTINAEIPYVNKSKLRYMGDTSNYYQDSVTVAYKGLDTVLVKILTTFMSIDLSHNSFHGAIPSSIGDLKSLVGLNLSGNNFNGSIPTSLGKLSELESLDLSKNKLSGKIPYELVSLTFLQHLNLSDNKLVGPIPHGKQFDTFENSSFGGNLDLCGFQLAKKCTVSDNEQPKSNHGQDSESENGFGWKAALVGYGCGIVIGLVVEHVLGSRRPTWLSGIYRRISLRA